MSDFHDCAVLRAMQTCAPLNCAREETCFRLASFLREHGCQKLANWLPDPTEATAAGDLEDAVEETALDIRIGGWEAA